MTEKTIASNDGALRTIEQAVLEYYQGDLSQREMIAEIVMTLEGAGYMRDAHQVRAEFTQAV